MSLVLVGSTSGSVTLQEPAVAGTTVLTLPAVSGTILTTTSPKAGNVIQVVQVGSNGGTTTSTSFVDMGLSASITPTSSSSKILVIVNGVIRTNGTVRAGFAIVRGSTSIQSATEMALFDGSQANSYYITVLDSPATTSSTTYKVQFVSNNGTTIRTDDAGSVAVGNINYITLMEIAA